MIYTTSFMFNILKETILEMGKSFVSCLGLQAEEGT